VIGAPFGTNLAETLGWRGSIFGYAGIALAGAAVFALLYRSPGATQTVAGPHGPAAIPALRNPLVWGMVLLGLINMGGFSVTFFVPYAVETVFGLDAQAAARLISASYLVAIVLNLAFGYLCDRYSRWNMMIVLAILLIPASLAVMSDNLVTFRIAVALIVSLGHAATNQLYAIVGTLLPKEEVGKGAGVLGLGSGVFGYLGPQMLGYLRDATGGFTAGWIFVSVAAGLSLVDVAVLRMYSLRIERRTTSGIHAGYSK
jgi:predicted MFS family arabinose efflux permease